MTDLTNYACILDAALALLVLVVVANIVPVMLLLTSRTVVAGDGLPELRNKRIACERASLLVLDQVVGGVTDRVDVVDLLAIVLARDLTKPRHLALSGAFVVEVGHLVFELVLVNDASLIKREDLGFVFL